MLSLLSMLLLLLSVAAAQVYVGFPFSEQLPNVARVNQPYSFQVADSTYKSTNGPNNINYYASDLPQWLSFDKASRTFTGTPSSADVGNFQVSLSGYDTSDGTSMSNNYSMVVSQDQGLHLTSPDAMFVQIAKYGQTNGNDGLVVKQGEKFSIHFDKDVFESYANSTRPIIAYYGRSQDRSPLPNWVSFNADDLSFSGTVPYVTSENAPSSGFGFGFIASDYYGFAGAEGIFKLIVGGHQLSTSLNETIKLNGTLGDDVNIKVPIFSDVFLDGSPITPQNISKVSAVNLPDYLVLNTENYTITGKYPTHESNDNFTVEVQDIYQNSVVLPYSLDAIGSVFTVKSLPDVNATKGKYFTYQLLDSFFTDVNDTKLTVSYPSADWLDYHQENKTFNGMAPSKLDKLRVNISASSSYDQESKSFNIVGVKEQTSSSTSSTSSSTSSTSLSSGSSSSSGSSGTSSSSGSSTSHKKSNHKALAIGLGTGLGVLALGILALILFLCCARRKKEDSEKDGDDSDTETELNGPGFGTTVDKDDHDENARQLSTLNVLNLDKGKLDYDDEVKSTSSSITHVESDDGFFDASEKPVKSWRAQDASDAALASKLPKRASEASLSTVNTEQLFSVRLVDDPSRRNSQQSSSLHSRNLLSNNSLNGYLQNSSNIQRLDSDGNIVETLEEKPVTVEKPRLSRSASTNLDVLVEENSKEYTNIHREDTDNSSFNLLAKFHESRHPSQANSEKDLSNYNIGKNSILDDDDDDIFDEFKATKISDGEFKWEENTSGGNITTSTVIVPRVNYHNDFVSPSSDHFIFGNGDTPVTLKNSPMKNGNLSALSLGSNESLHLGSNKQATTSDFTLHSKPGKSKAKLVEFTRKGSLRESAYEPDQQYHGHSAQIHEDDSD